MISILRRGIKPEQKKEPALNRDIQVFTENVAISRLIPETKDIDSISPEKIIEIARIAEIADELDGKPLWEKLESSRGKASGVAADALDDEPYLSSRLVLILQRREDVASGLSLCGKALGVEADKQFAAVFHSLIAFSTKIPDGEDMRIRRLNGKYPIDLAEREKGERSGVLYIGAGAMVHLHRAVFEMRRQTTAFVTLAGDCVSAPFNAELPLGMPLKRALEFCGLSEEPTYICTNGSLTASPVLDPESAFVEVDTKAILAFHRYDHAQPAPCIGCGRCMEVCPQQLPVFYLYQASLHKQLSLLRRMGYERCYECGACTYACPSHLDLVPMLRQGKELVSAGLPEDLIQQSRETQEQPEPAQEAEAPEEVNAAGTPPSEVPEPVTVEDVKEPVGAVPTPESAGGEQEPVPAVPEEVGGEEAEEIAAMRETQFGREVLSTAENPEPEETEQPPDKDVDRDQMKKRSKKRQSEKKQSPEKGERAASETSPRASQKDVESAAGAARTRKAPARKDAPSGGAKATPKKAAARPVSSRKAAPKAPVKRPSRGTQAKEKQEVKKP